MSLKTLAKIAFPFILLSVFGYAAFIIVFAWPVALGNVDKAGVFGDSFGVLTSLFSGLAFAGIILALAYQKEELELQREELKHTRGELRNQVNAMKKQSFESTFFQLVRLYSEILNGIDLPKGKNLEATGRDCFVEFYNLLTGYYQAEIKSEAQAKRLHRAEPRDKTERMEEVYKKFWGANQKDLGHYFRFLYRIFRFIDESDVKDKRLYSNIVRAQISDDELLLLFYNCLYIHGRERFKPLVEKYSLFDNLPIERLLDREHKDLYAPAAFSSDSSGANSSTQ